MKKKILITLLTITMAFGVVACGNGSASKNNSGKQDSTVESGSTKKEDSNINSENSEQTSDSEKVTYENTGKLVVTIDGHDIEMGPQYTEEKFNEDCAAYGWSKTKERPNFVIDGVGSFNLAISGRGYLTLIAASGDWVTDKSKFLINGISLDDYFKYESILMETYPHEGNAGDDIISYTVGTDLTVTVGFDYENNKVNSIECAFYDVNY